MKKRRLLRTGSALALVLSLGLVAACEEETAVDEPVVEEPVVEEPVVEEPAVEEPAVEEPAVEEPTTEEPAEEFEEMEEPQER